jgi:hypothetical protein
MRQQARIGALLLIGVGVVLGATVFRADIAQATGLAQAVTVTNSPAQAVPVREQNLDGNGFIKIHEQGVAKVVNANEPSYQPFQANFGNTILDGGYGACADLTVPAGKRLVIELVTFDGYLNDPDHDHYKHLWLNTTVSGNFTSHYLSFEQVPGDQFWHGSETLRLYADPPIVSMCADRHEIGVGSFHGSLSGYLVDA